MSHPEILNESRPKRRVHKRTLAIVFCFVTLPWILVAVPGEEFLRWRGGIGHRRVCYTHGWPFQHLVRNEVIVDGTSVDGKYIPGQIPPQLELDELARESVPDQPSLKLNLKFRKVENFDSRDNWGIVMWNRNSWVSSQWPTVKSDGTGFWTAPFKWFKSGTGHYWEIQPLGLVCNLIILALATLLVGWIVERKLARQGRIFKFSLRTLLLATAFVAIGISWLVQEFSRFQKHQQQVDYFSSERTFTNPNYDHHSLHLDAKFKSRFPLVVSQLLNHGELPFVDPKFFVALDSQDSGSLYICLFFDEEMDHQKIQKIAQLAAESPFSVTLYIRGYGRQIEKSLVDFENVSLMGLDIQFHTPDGVDSFGNHEEFTGDYSKDPKFSGDKVNITADFPHLKRLTLHLGSTLGQESQLKSFCGLNSLEEVKLVGLSQPGVDFLLKTKEEWPRKIEFEFTPNVSEASKELLWQHFDRTYKFGG